MTAYAYTRIPGLQSRGLHLVISHRESGGSFPDSFVAVRAGNLADYVTVIRGVGTSVQGVLAPRDKPANNPQHVETCAVVLRSTAYYSLQISRLPPDFIPLLLPIHQSINICLAHTVLSIRRPHPSTHDNKWWRPLKQARPARKHPRRCKSIRNGAFNMLHYRVADH